MKALAIHRRTYRREDPAQVIRPIVEIRAPVHPRNFFPLVAMCQPVACRNPEMFTNPNVRFRIGSWPVDWRYRGEINRLATTSPPSRLTALEADISGGGRLHRIP